MSFHKSYAYSPMGRAKWTSRASASLSALVSLSNPRRSYGENVFDHGIHEYSGRQMGSFRKNGRQKGSFRKNVNFRPAVSKGRQKGSFRKNVNFRPAVSKQQRRQMGSRKNVNFRSEKSKGVP